MDKEPIVFQTNTKNIELISFVLLCSIFFIRKFVCMMRAVSNKNRVAKFAIAFYLAFSFGVKTKPDIWGRVAHFSFVELKIPAIWLLAPMYNTVKSCSPWSRKGWEPLLECCLLTHKVVITIIYASYNRT